MKTNKILLIIGILIVSLLFINELRYVIWDAYGVPEESDSPNCGENRYKFDVKINSPEEFLSVISSFKKTDLPENDQEYVAVTQRVLHSSEQYTLQEVASRKSGSFFFSKKIYGIHIKNPECMNSMVLEISEDGYASVRGCCGK